MQDRVTKQVVPLPSLIPELSTRPFHPPLVLEAGNGIQFQLLPLFNIVGPFLGLTRNLGACHLTTLLGFYQIDASFFKYKM
jgi:hypothetical protein